jgi:uncharacterized membrane protein YbaN (DUF454 family)
MLIFFDIMKSMNKKIKISESEPLRQMWFVLGLISTGLGIAGYILPVMPGTTFILIAAYCFARSSEKWYNKLLKSKWFGQTIKDFYDGRGMSLKAKWTAYIMIVASISISFYFATNVYVEIFLIVCGIVGLSAVFFQKTKKNKVIK